ncbi:hypothetical protein NRS6120_22310 [Bacillus subtilis]|nr:hypothetical protein NRS6120_22310 [Bacillus subtilis]
MISVYEETGVKSLFFVDPKFAEDFGYGLETNLKEGLHAHQTGYSSGSNDQPGFGHYCVPVKWM